MTIRRSVGGGQATSFGVYGREWRDMRSSLCLPRYAIYCSRSMPRMSANGQSYSNLVASSGIGSDSAIVISCRVRSAPYPAWLLRTPSPATPVRVAAVSPEARGRLNHLATAISIGFAHKRFSISAMTTERPTCSPPECQPMDGTRAVLAVRHDRFEVVVQRISRRHCGTNRAVARMLLAHLLPLHRHEVGQVVLGERLPRGGQEESSSIVTYDHVG